MIAFDAHVLEWSLDNNPPDHHARHFIKEASFYGVDSYTVDMVIKLPNSNPDSDSDSGDKVFVNWVGLEEQGMWPAKKGIKDIAGLSMQLFEKMDPWIEEKMSGKVDALLMGCVAGVARI